ncbi:hypothetical protein [Streptomyces blastmyceticus]|uniref:Uncharacterized protein n=1 Tax=Streptomyces blastmyceticus TaxID=68180 RepID=A0ABN0XSD8_9ACTN
MNSKSSVVKNGGAVKYSKSESARGVEFIPIDLGNGIEKYPSGTRLNGLTLEAEGPFDRGRGGRFVSSMAGSHYKYFYAVEEVIAGVKVIVSDDELE